MLLLFLSRFWSILFILPVSGIWFFSGFFFGYFYVIFGLTFLLCIHIEEGLLSLVEDYVHGFFSITAGIFFLRIFYFFVLKMGFLFFL
jgi:hypothetical protein